MAGAGRGPRVIAGAWGGRRLEAPRGDRTRPTSDRVKESVFGALADAVVGATVLDLFAGSGALALEALSRGAERAVLVERDATAAAVIARNVEALDAGAVARVLRRAVLPALRDAPPPEAPFGLVLADPPYDTPATEVAAILEALAAPGWLAPGARVVLERPVAADGEPRPDGWMVAWSRTYGDTLVVVVTPSADRS